MMILKDILYKVAIESVQGTTDLAVEKIEFDPRKVRQDDIFVDIRGTLSDGHAFIEKDINQGAVAVVCETLPEKIDARITYIKVINTHSALAFMATNFYGNPSRNLKLVGVTGTNGKTTVASLLYQLFTNAGYKVGLLSTVKIIVGDVEHKATHTTPDSLTLNFYLKELAQNLSSLSS